MCGWAIKPPSLRLTYTYLGPINSIPTPVSIFELNVYHTRVLHSNLRNLNWVSLRPFHFKRKAKNALSLHCICGVSIDSNGIVLRVVRCPLRLPLLYFLLKNSLQALINVARSVLEVDVAVWGRFITGLNCSEAEETVMINLTDLSGPA